MRLGEVDDEAVLDREDGARVQMGMPGCLHDEVNVRWTVGALPGDVEEPADRPVRWGSRNGWGRCAEAKTPAAWAREKAAAVAGRLRIRLLDVAGALLVALLHVDLHVGHWRPFGVEGPSGHVAELGDQVVAVAERARWRFGQVEQAQDVRWQDELLRVSV